MDTQVDEGLLTFQEAMAYLKISRSTMYRFLRDGTLRGFKVGAHWRFNKEQLKGCLK